MKRKYLIATHGKLANGFQSSLNILANKGEEVEVINAYIDETDFSNQLENFLNQVSEEEQAVIFTDLLGGSVNQKAVLKQFESGKENVFMITNTNLAIILSIMFNEEKLSEKIIEKMLSESQVQLVKLTQNDEAAFFD